MFLYTSWRIVYYPKREGHQRSDTQDRDAGAAAAVARLFVFLYCIHSHLEREAKKFLYFSCLCISFPVYGTNHDTDATDFPYTFFISYFRFYYSCAALFLFFFILKKEEEKHVFSYFFWWGRERTGGANEKKRKTFCRSFVVFFFLSLLFSKVLNVSGGRRKKNIQSEIYALVRPTVSLHVLTLSPRPAHV